MRSFFFYAYMYAVLIFVYSLKSSITAVMLYKLTQDTASAFLKPAGMLYHFVIIQISPYEHLFIHKNVLIASQQVDANDYMNLFIAVGYTVCHRIGHRICYCGTGFFNTGRISTSVRFITFME